MTAFYNTLPCSAGGTHEWGVRPFLSDLAGSEQYCVKCDMGWGDVNRQMEALLPTKEGMYRGQGFLWYCDGEGEWESWNGGGTTPHWDMPMKRVRLVEVEDDE